MRLLILAADNLTRLQPKIDRYRASVEAKGVATEQINIPLAMSVPDVALIARSHGSDPVQIFGHVACPQVFDDADGHGNRASSKDILYAVNASDVAITYPDGSYQLNENYVQSRAVGRADFSGMPDIGDEFALMGAWLDLNDAYRTGAFRYDNASVLNCELDYLIPGTGDRLIAIMEAVTGAGSVLDTRGKFPFKQWYQTYSGKTFLIGSMYDGGEPFFIGEYNTGSAHDFASGLVQMAVMLLFCSRGWETDPWYLQRTALVGGSQAVTYGTWNPPHLNTWSGNVPIGAAFQNLGAMKYTVCGDVMLLRPTGGGDLSQSQYDQLLGMINVQQGEIADLNSRVTTLEGDVVVKPPPPGGIKRNLGGPTVGEWQAITGTPNIPYSTPVPVSVAGVANAGPPEIYATGLTAPNGTSFQCTETLAPGNYTFRAHGEESYNSTPRRAQDIYVNGVKIFANIDWLIVAGGMSKAGVLSAPVTIGPDKTAVVKINSNGPDTVAWMNAYEFDPA